MSNKVGPKKLSRRDFLKSGATVTAAGLAATAMPARVLAHKAHEKNRRLGMVLDLEKCTGCHSCSVACKAKFDVPLGVWRSWVKIKEKGRFPKTKRFFLPRLCNHCDNPPCVKVCPSGASQQREDGIVWIDEKICVGCKLCIAACPYQARFVNPVKKLADKCDLCKHLLDKGVVPACVNACPAGVRVAGDLNDPNSAASKLVRSKPAQTLKPELGTGPQVFYLGADHTVLEGGERK